MFCPFVCPFVSLFAHVCLTFFLILRNGYWRKQTRRWAKTGLNFMLPCSKMKNEMKLNRKIYQATSEHNLYLQLFCCYRWFTIGVCSVVHNKKTGTRHLIVVYDLRPETTVIATPYSVYMVWYQGMTYGFRKVYALMVNLFYFIWIKTLFITFIIRNFLVMVIRWQKGKAR